MQELLKYNDEKKFLVKTAIILAIIGISAIPVIVSSETTQGEQGNAVNIPTTIMSPMSEHPKLDEINLAIVSVFSQYRVENYPIISNIIIRLISCESGFNTKAYNPKDTDGLPAYGILQFKMKTFMTYAKRYGIKNPDIWNPKQQIEVAILMIRDGQVRQWGCF